MRADGFDVDVKREKSFTQTTRKLVFKLAPREIYINISFIRTVPDVIMHPLINLMDFHTLLLITKCTD